MKESVNEKIRNQLVPIVTLLELLKTNSVNIEDKQKAVINKLLPVEEESIKKLCTLGNNIYDNVTFYIPLVIEKEKDFYPLGIFDEKEKAIAAADKKYKSRYRHCTILIYEFDLNDCSDLTERPIVYGFNPI